MKKRQKIAIILLLVAGVVYEAPSTPHPLHTVQRRNRNANICWEVALVSRLQVFYVSYSCSIDSTSTRISATPTSPNSKLIP